MKTFVKLDAEVGAAVAKGEFHEALTRRENGYISATKVQARSKSKASETAPFLVDAEGPRVQVEGLESK